MTEAKLDTPASSSRSLPDFKKCIKLKYVKLGYHYLITHGMYLFLSPLVVLITAQSSAFPLKDLYDLWEHLQYNLISIIVCSTLLVFLSTLYFLTRPRPVYLVDYSCYKPEECPKCTKRIFMDQSRMTARKEAETVMFGAIDELFAKTCINPRDIGILIVNCTLFNPTPSLSAMIVKYYKLRGNIKSFNLGGMGCSAVLISIDLARDLLQSCFQTKALTKRRSKYRLVHTVRTNKAADDKCFSCVTQEEDANGKVGVTLSKDLMVVAGDALKTNITTLGPLVLPMSEQLLFFATLVGKKFFQMKIKPYIPDFKLAFEHFCIHAGGRAVLDELEKNLQLSTWHMEASRMTLHRFGNTSSSSLWYELAYTEAKGRMNKGDRLWQIAFGSGFKCNSAVWKALRTVNPAKEKSPWVDEIDQFPVEVPRVATI
ncbi:hypothetical protein L6164_011346 [Bauhinia variegata]|uniref:Uncharacterized protein n=1 Tax=Bauhinia variegata TaxID=167791 RepID=A0ACB9P7X8_BAUVA|nr:hypothetical protein L6164_011346 [Bauhinia variegata]